MLLEHRAVSALEAIEHLGGMQSQAPDAPYVGLWTRVEGFRADEERHPDEYPVLVAILELARRGVTARRIARLLNEAGAPTRHRRRWWTAGVIGILRRHAPEVLVPIADRPADYRPRRREAERRRQRTRLSDDLL